MKSPVVKLECFTFVVDDGNNKVSWDFQDSWICTCEDFYYRKHECKHIKQVKKELRSQVNDALLDHRTCHDALSDGYQSKLVV